MAQQKQIHLASTSSIKQLATQQAYGAGYKIVLQEVSSKVSSQPFGKREIEQGCLNRLNLVFRFPTVSCESGIYVINGEHYEVTCCKLRTRVGTLTEWSRAFKLPVDMVAKWLECDNKTFGEVNFPDCAANWYHKVDNTLCRINVMRDAISVLHSKHNARLNMFPTMYFPADSIKFRGISFLTLQQSLMKQPKDLYDSVWALTSDLAFDAVVLVGAAGYLFAGPFMQRGIPIIQCNKKGKLAGECWEEKYDTEYSTDQVNTIIKSTLKPGMRVVVWDDFGATGGTFQSVQNILKQAQCVAVAFCCLYTIEWESGFLPNKPEILEKFRFISTKKEAELPINNMVDEPSIDSDTVYIVPPSMKSLFTDGKHNIAKIDWKKFNYSPDIWFDASTLAGKHIKVIGDPSNSEEFLNLLQFNTMLFKLKPLSVQFVLPFIDHSTQDRVEYRDNMESLAMIDTIAKLIRKTEVVTFDIHSEQTRWAFHDLNCKTSLVKLLWNKFVGVFGNSVCVAFPDQGAQKRFQKMVGVDSAVCFAKIRDGDKRIITTYDKVVKDGVYVIVDDLVRSGGTMNAGAQYLLDNGAKEVHALFAHAPLEPKAGHNMSIFDSVWTSDSCPNYVNWDWVKVRVQDIV